jgi:hypothetical protein
MLDLLLQDSELGGDSEGRNAVGQVRARPLLRLGPALLRSPVAEIAPTRRAHATRAQLARADAHRAARLAPTMRAPFDAAERPPRVCSQGGAGVAAMDEGSGGAPRAGLRAGARTKKKKVAHKFCEKNRVLLAGSSMVVSSGGGAAVQVRHGGGCREGAHSHDNLCRPALITTIRSRARRRARRSATGNARTTWRTTTLAS